MYNFDEVINRQNTACLSVDALEERFGSAKLTSLWVADMNFRTPDFIMNAIRKRCEHEILGYPVAPEGYYEAIISWLKKRHRLSVNKEDVGYLPGIVPGIAYAINCYTQKGAGIVIQPPIYTPFSATINNNRRKIIYNRLALGGNHFELDLKDFEACVSKASMFILCNPHNPGGRVWTRQELEQMAAICQRHNVLVISDEIHCDLTLQGYTHAPFANVSEWARNNSITFMSSTKTFNMAGLASAFYVIPSKELRNKFQAYLCNNECAPPNIFAYTATQAAFESGEQWLNQLLPYIQGNVDFVTGYLQKNIPQVKAVKPQATYLIWLDFRALNLPQAAIRDLLAGKAKLALNDGATFGPGGEGFMRMNLARPQSVIKQALGQLKQAVQP
ncbi:MAG: pyridoxal phosphate-dependent aminotransferase [Prevotellaceae bacterium]|jgi:cystathionine beta-lyase|nr:pyridoxal phosphate-dependent aminotransferase [Prevotellaceae bacterium]